MMGMKNMECNIFINGLKIAEVPDLYNFKSFVGSCCYDIFSSYGIINEIITNSHKLKIDIAKYDHNDLPKILSDLLVNSEIEVKNAAEDIVADFGRRLGLIVYILKTATLKNRQANIKHGDEDWQVWIDCRKIFLAGGLVNGLLGERLRYYAQKLLYELNIRDAEFIISKFPSDTQMIGCARLNKGDNKKALLFDFGHSFVKTGLAAYEGNSLSHINLLPKIKSQYMNNNYPDKEAEYKDAVNLHNFIVKIITDYYFKFAKGDCSSHIVISIANKVTDGKIGWGGCYYKLMFVNDKYERYLEKCVSEILGLNIAITLVHDGQAAAICFAEQEKSALIALGTAFGVGYPEPIPFLKDASNVKIINKNTSSL